MKNYGLIFRLESMWIGCHYSSYNKRFCLNLIPFVTFWWIQKGGVRPVYDGSTITLKKVLMFIINLELPKAASYAINK